MSKAPRILFVGHANSVHTARWLRQIADLGWDLHLFHSTGHGLAHPLLTNVTVHHLIYGKRPEFARGTLRIKGINVVSYGLAWVIRRFLDTLWPKYREIQLAYLVRRLRPDLIHSMEFQASAYLTLAVKQRLGGHLPKWLVTNWGSDISLFGQIPEHANRIRRILEECDYYSCECQRDVMLARGQGLCGQVLPVLPNAGGFDLRHVKGLHRDGRTSARRSIMVKGYQGWAGRALVALRALERCADLLAGYTVVVYSASDDVRLAVQLFSQRTGVPVELLPPDTPHDAILSCHGKARISLALSIGDGISTSMLEALVMGSFPIQSNTACADEWIRHGVTGMLVPPEDPEVIERCLRRALTDDELVDGASEANWRVAEQRLDGEAIRAQVVRAYQQMLGLGEA